MRKYILFRKKSDHSKIFVNKVPDNCSIISATRGALYSRILPDEVGGIDYYCRHYQIAYTLRERASDGSPIFIRDENINTNLVEWINLQRYYFK